jgi:transcriptional regulator with XRE-family HTH domain
MDVSEHPIRAYRLSQKPPMRQADLAKRVGTTKFNLSRIETGKQTLTEDLLFRFVAETPIPARKLRPDLAELFVPSRGRGRPRRVKAAARKRAA